ncbi:hypothetical protein [Leifsonia poae]|uniref:hypothetical protein n=1 Tax=Leifsonia poae TaxID=110933 RepID=UPI001CBE5499|nr:hypothetical protein [Leifsonia poae]
MLSRIVNSLLLFVVGVVVGAVGTIAHQSSWRIGGLVIPWGLVAALVAFAAVLAGLRLLARSRIPALIAAVGTIGVIVLFSQQSAGGSVFILNDLPGQIWVVGPILIAAVVMAWPDLSRSRGPVHPAETA